MEIRDSEPSTLGGEGHYLPAHSRLLAAPGESCQQRVELFKESIRKGDGDIIKKVQEFGKHHHFYEGGSAG